MRKSEFEPPLAREKVKLLIIFLSAQDFSGDREDYRIGRFPSGPEICREPVLF